mmetsp:Transcript_31003/g.47498  ORF Transcript_31003/g.47498 Transcript_31003/m.47498 type:complete len:89 (-) Transcript_31003:26-292(-)
MATLTLPLLWADKLNQRERERAPPKKLQHLRRIVVVPLFFVVCACSLKYNVICFAAASLLGRPLRRTAVYHALCLVVVLYCNVCNVEC